MYIRKVINKLNIKPTSQLTTRVKNIDCQQLLSFCQGTETHRWTRRREFPSFEWSPQCIPALTSTATDFCNKRFPLTVDVNEQGLFVENGLPEIMFHFHFGKSQWPVTNSPFWSRKNRALCPVKPASADTRQPKPKRAKQFLTCSSWHLYKEAPCDTTAWLHVSYPFMSVRTPAPHILGIQHTPWSTFSESKDPGERPNCTESDQNLDSLTPKPRVKAPRPMALVVSACPHSSDWSI